MRAIAAAATIITALLCAWAVWQPQRSAAATDKVIALSDRGKIDLALRQADRARDINPYSTEPLYAKAIALTQAKQIVPAYRVLEQAVAEHPRDPETWLRLGNFELTQLDLPVRALASANAAYSIDRQSPRINGLANSARNEITADQAALNPQPMAPVPAPKPKPKPKPKKP